MAVHTVVESQPAGTDTGYTPRRSRQVSGEKLTHTLFYAEETNENLVTLPVHLWSTVHWGGPVDPRDVEDHID